MILMTLEGTSVLVTGGAGGIGQAICRHLARQGSKVIVHYRTSRSEAESLAGEIDGIAVYADLRKKDDVDKMFSQIEEEIGLLQCCVANAGMYPPEPMPVWEISEDRWNSTLESNLGVTVLTAQGFLKGAVASGRGSLVLIGSTAGVHGERGHSDYATAKGAITSGLLRTLKNDVSGTSIRVNAVAPGWTLTDSKIESGIDREIASNAMRTMSMKKLASPEDVAGAVAFLLSDVASGHISGQVIEVSGGMEGRVIPGPGE